MQGTIRHCIAWGILLVFVLGTSPLLAAEEDLTIQARAILQTHCGGCHAADGKAKGGFDYVLDRERLVNRNKIVPGKAAQSPLFQRVRDGEMPPVGRKAPSTDEIAVLQRWIDAGAPAKKRSPTSLLTYAAVQRFLLADLQNVEPRQRRFMRYLTLNHLPQARRV